MTLEEVSQQYNLADLTVSDILRGNKQIVQFRLEPKPIKELKQIIERVINELYADRYIQSAVVTIHPKKENLTFVDIAVVSSESTRPRTKKYSLKDIWLLRSTHKNGDYVSMTYSTPKFYNVGEGNGNQLLLQVTFNVNDPYEYLISSALEISDKGTKKVVSRQVHPINSDREFNKQSAVPLFTRILDLNKVYCDSLSAYIAKGEDQPALTEEPTELWQAHKEYID